MLGKILKAMYLTFKAMIGIPIAVAVTSAAVMFAGFSSLWAGAASHIKKSKFGRNKNTPGDESRNALRDSLWGLIGGVWSSALSGVTEALTFVGVSTSDSRNLDPTDGVPGKIEIPSSDEKKDVTNNILGDVKNGKGLNNAINSANKKVPGNIRSAGKENSNKPLKTPKAEQLIKDRSNKNSVTSPLR